MKLTLDLPVRYMDVGSDGNLRINSLLAYLQEAAIWHASKCGDGPDEIKKRGAGWALIKIGVDIGGIATYGDILTIETWSRGSSGLKAYREFIVRKGDSIIARGTSVWVYMNIAAGRMMRIEDSHMDRYTREPDLATELEIDRWKPARIDDAAFIAPIRIRAQDIDTNQHVNNTQYAAFVDSALREHLEKPPIYKQVLISFERAIASHQDSAEVSLGLAEDKVVFAVSSEDSVCCRGQAIIAPFKP